MTNGILFAVTIFAKIKVEKKSTVNIDEEHSKIRLVNKRLVSSFKFIQYPQHMYI